jgi:hypothetical protein
LLHHLGRQNPYALNKEPFLQLELKRNWEARKRAAEVRAARLEVERSFRIAPAGERILLGEDPEYEKPVRDSTGLSWAEERLRTELKFQPTLEGSTIAFVREYQGSLVFADIRAKGQITFYIYVLPQEADARHPSSTSFHLSDRVTRDLVRKWEMHFDVAARAAKMGSR